MIRFWCQCGRRLKANERAAGEFVRCPLCRRMHLVPESDLPRTADFPPVPPRGYVNASGEIVRAETTAISDGVPLPLNGAGIERPTSRPARLAWFLGLTAALASAIVFVAAQWVVFLVVDLPGDVAWLAAGGPLGVVAIVLGVVALADRRVRSGEWRGRDGALGGIGGGLLAMLLASGAATVGQYVLHFHARGQERENLRRIGHATHDYADEHHVLPPAVAYRTRDGKPGLSWRVALLPHLGQGELYRQFRLDEPWDSPNNLPLLAKMPAVYRRPGQKDASGMTHYQVFVGPKTAFEPPGGIRLSHITDGTSTLLVATAQTPVPWTKPDDLAYDPAGSLPPLAYDVRIGRVRYSIGCPVLVADGRVTYASKDTPEAVLRGVITRNGGEAVSLP